MCTLCDVSSNSLRLDFVVLGLAPWLDRDGLSAAAISSPGTLAQKAARNKMAELAAAAEQSAGMPEKTTVRPLIVVCSLCFAPPPEIPPLPTWLRP